MHVKESQPPIWQPKGDRGKAILKKKRGRRCASLQYSPASINYIALARLAFRHGCAGHPHRGGAVSLQCAVAWLFTGAFRRTSVFTGSIIQSFPLFIFFDSF